jgi:glycosyltransferase involved in cell wall biosynthesis
VNKLAIIIPAYKSEYFAQALDSLANQTNKHFVVYVGDDCSPNNLKAICDQFTDSLQIYYIRFDKNIGARNLVDQWSRCVDMCKSEDWIWLFSDDDIAQENCVEKFYETLTQTNQYFDVYRFNTQVIDKDGNFLGARPHGPLVESSAEMAYNLFLNKRGNSMPDHIFSRRIYESTGGFVKTLYAQGADWATSIKFSKERGMRIIPDALLSWRYSGSNISSKASKKRVEMTEGYFQFFKWVCGHFMYLKKEGKSAFYDDLMNANIEKFKDVLRNHYNGIHFLLIFKLIKLLRNELGMSYPKIFKFLRSISG